MPVPSMIVYTPHRRSGHTVEVRTRRFARSTPIEADSSGVCDWQTGAGVAWVKWRRRTGHVAGVGADMPFGWISANQLNSATREIWSILWVEVTCQRRERPTSHPVNSVA